MIAVNYHDDLNEVQGDPLLAAVLSAPGASAPFDRLEWWRNLCDSFNIKPLIAIARSEAAGVAIPFMQVKRRLELLTCWYSFRMEPLLFGDVDYRGEEDLQLLSVLGRDLAKQTSHLRLSPVPNEHRGADRLASGLRASGWAVFVEQCDVNHVLPVGGRSYAEFLANRPGQLRTTLKRKSAKVETTIYHQFTDGIWDAYEAVYRASWKPEEGSFAFLRRFADEEAAAGRLRLGIAWQDGAPVAAQLWTVERHTAFIHKLAHTEAAKPLSPGTTLSAALFAHAIDVDRVALVDFGTGDDPYKRDWMETVRPRYRIEAFRPGHPGNWPTLARRLLRGLARGADHG